MENIIVIICDSLSYHPNMLDDMPRLKGYKENMISFNNYFSQAPYTEAAIVPIFTSTNVTDYQGYFNNLKDKPLNINKVFKSLGYKTYNTLWFYPNTLSFLDGVDEYDYMDSAIISPLTTYRINYFRELYGNKQFKNEHMEMIMLLFDDFFSMAEIYINDYINNPYRLALITKYTKFKYFYFDKFQIDLEENKTRYFTNKHLYIEDLLENNNMFFNMDSSNIIRSSSFKEKSKHLNLSLVPIILKQFYFALKNHSQNKCLDTLSYRLRNRANKSIVSSIMSWISSIVHYTGKYNYQFLSAKVILDRTFDYLSNHKNEKNFVITHIMDTHAPFNFFSSELDHLEEEFESFSNYRQDFSKKESNIYRYTKLYIDNQISDLMDKLEKNNMLEDTTIIITSDHGSSFIGKINRNEFDYTFYDEKYRIPFMIFNKKISSRDINHLSISTQFIPTILDFLQVKDNYQWIEKNSIFKANKQYIIFEYFGSGCPDYINQARLFCIRSEHYKVQYKVYPESWERPDEVLAVYDLYKDPKELVDVKDILKDSDDLAGLIKAIRQRMMEVKELDEKFDKNFLFR